MFIITKEWLKKKKACSTGYEWFLKQKETKADKVLLSLAKDNRWGWASWTIVRIMNRKQCLEYAIFAAEQVLNIYEKEYPNNDTPRKAIEAAKKVLKNDTPTNKKAARAAATAADTATDAARAAHAAAYAAAYAADTANAAYNAAYTAATAAGCAARAAATAAARNKMRMRILKYGISLL